MCHPCLRHETCSRTTTTASSCKLASPKEKVITVPCLSDLLIKHAAFLLRQDGRYVMPPDTHSPFTHFPSLTDWPEKPLHTQRDNVTRHATRVTHTQPGVARLTLPFCANKRRESEKVNNETRHTHTGSHMCAPSHPYIQRDTC